jgi:hypothetical protein
MNGYVEAGYLVVLGTLSTYASTLAVRERAARRRAGRPNGHAVSDASLVATGSETHGASHEDESVTATSPLAASRTIATEARRSASGGEGARAR